LNRYQQHKSASVVGVLTEQVDMGQIAFFFCSFVIDLHPSFASGTRPVRTDDLCLA
jgi:hypothetical protein